MCDAYDGEVIGSITASQYNLHLHASWHAESVRNAWAVVRSVHWDSELELCWLSELV